jgi:aminopeptidase N
MTDTPDHARQIVALEQLLTHIADARAAMDAQLTNATSDFELLLRKFREEHHQHIERVSGILFALGQEPDASGSMRGRAASMLNAVKALLDAPGTGDADALANAGSTLLQEFDAAIRATPANQHRDDLEDMREELAGLIAEARGR